MAEAVDPFEAALSAMNEPEGGEPGDNKELPQDEQPAEQQAQPALDPFEAALSAIGQDDIGGGGAENAAEALEDPFDAALQVAQTEHNIAEAQKPEKEAGKSLDVSFLLDIKLNITFEVGRAKMYISDLLSLGQGSVIELHRLVGEELELFVNGHLFATGEVVVVNEKFGARITKIITPEERIQRLSSHG